MEIMNSQRLRSLQAAATPSRSALSSIQMPMISIYPTYSLASQQLASKLRVEQLLSGALGKIVRKYARMVG